MKTTQRISRSSKKGRNLKKCTRYKDLNVRLTNKKRKVEKHLRKHPNDLDASNSI